MGLVRRVNAETLRVEKATLEGVLGKTQADLAASSEKAVKLSEELKQSRKDVDEARLAQADTALKAESARNDAAVQREQVKRLMHQQQMQQQAEGHAEESWAAAEQPSLQLQKHESQGKGKTEGRSGSISRSEVSEATDTDEDDGSPTAGDREAGEVLDKGKGAGKGAGKGKSKGKGAGKSSGELPPPAEDGRSGSFSKSLRSAKNTAMTISQTTVSAVRNRPIVFPGLKSPGLLLP
eukprot:SAG22_NODE_480_length_9955_cov_3.601258_7_plen_237_part_00